VHIVLVHQKFFHHFETAIACIVVAFEELLREVKLEVMQ
jgi:hypothetical protein